VILGLTDGKGRLMAKHIPLPCTETNCGNLLPKCGKRSTYNKLKCRCDTCYAANAEYEKRYNAANPEKVAEQSRRTYLNNREAICEKRRLRHSENREAHSERMKKYYAENREAHAKRKKRYREANREKIAAANKRYREENRDAIRADGQRYYRENREAHAERTRRRRLANPERWRQIQRQYQGRRRARMMEVQAIDFTPEQFEQRMAYYGNSCYLKLPGLCTGAFDEVEHVKPIAQLGPHMLANLRPVCLPCNRRKWAHWPFNAPCR
jgi:hypothetical protein